MAPPRRLHVSTLGEGPLRLEGEGFHYLVRVLRLTAGDVLVLFDGAGREADGSLRDVAADHAVVLVGQVRAGARPAAPHLTLVLALLKGDKMDLVVQKTTELGVDAIVPVSAARAVVHLDGPRAQARQARWRRIAEEAARQCGRADVPDIAAVMPFATAIAPAPATTAAWRGLLDPGAIEVLRPAGLPREGSWLVAVGPEGGFAPDEVAAARAAGWNGVTLGPRILRAETAAIAIVAGLRLFGA